MLFRSGRKAMQMLADLSIIDVAEKKCAVVASEERAKYYLESLKARKERHELSDRMKTLFKSYQDIGKELEDVSGQLIDALAYPMPSEKMIPTFEVPVREKSDKIGRTIGSLRVWQATGSTIIAVRRGQNIIISPGPYEKLLEENDLDISNMRLDGINDNRNGDKIRKITNNLEEFLCETGCDKSGTFDVSFDGKHTRAFAGWQYFCRLHHHAWKKLQARGIHAPYDELTGQPSRCGALTGQRMGEMENWALLSHGAFAVLESMRKNQTGYYNKME